MKEFFARVWKWIKTDGKTTLVAVVYAIGEALNLMPDIHDLTWEQLGTRVLRVAAVALIGILARDRKAVTVLEPKPDVPNGKV